MNKIKILLIDDNPQFAYKSNNAFDHIPLVKDDSFGSFPELKEFFEVQWLQSPEDTKEFRDYCLRYEGQFGAQELGALSVVPDIILFDYALSGESSKQILLKALEIMPNVLLGRKLNDISYRENSKKDFKAPYIEDKQHSLSEKEDSSLNQIGHDNMGCFSGGLIYSLFRNHPCSAIPITRKFFSHITGTHTHYFEWLIKDELFEATDLKGTTVSWSKVIPIATKNLRRQMEILITSRKITPSIIELIKYADITNLKGEERIFTYTSIYGIRYLPLDGLFIDKKNELLNPLPKDDKMVFEQYKVEGKITERDYEIWKFSSDILKILTDASGIETNTITKAKKIAEDLWIAATGDILRERFKLSELFAKKYLLGNKLSEDETELLTRYCSPDFYNVPDCKDIASKIKNNGRLTEQVSNRIFSIREHHKKEDADNKTKIVLATFFLVIRLDHHFKDFVRKNATVEKDNSLSTAFISKPTLKELLYLLFPSPRIPILMPGHLYHAGNEFKRKIIDDQFQKFFSRADDSGINWTTLPDDLDFAKIITPSEKIICQTYATSVGMSIEDYPQWLK